MTRSRRYEGILFDAGDILYDATPWRRWLTKQLQDQGLQVTYPQLVQRWEALLVDVYRGKADYWERFARLLRDYGIVGDDAAALAEDARAKGQAVQVGRQPFEGVVETLAALRDAGLRLAVLSDTESSSDNLRRGLINLGVNQFFHAVVTSFDIGHVKPEPEAYQAALDQLGTSRGHTAFVGHDRDELVGAHVFGLTTVAFNCDEDVPADFQLQRFDELVDILV